MSAFTPSAAAEAVRGGRRGFREGIDWQQVDAPTRQERRVQLFGAHSVFLTGAVLIFVLHAVHRQVHHYRFSVTGHQRSRRDGVPAKCKLEGVWILKLSLLHQR